jgi:hypothetical protein
VGYQVRRFGQTKRIAGTLSHAGQGATMPRPPNPAGPFRYLNSSPALIRQATMMYERFPLFLWNFEDLLVECAIDICQLWFGSTNLHGRWRYFLA